MKTKIGILSLVLAVLTFSACEEEGPVIDLGEGGGFILKDTTYMASSVEAPQDKVVLIEEFTGINCNNCPTGHATLEGILTANPGRVAVVSYHSLLLAYLGGPWLAFTDDDDLRAPIPGVTPDNAEPEAMSDFFGGVSFKPSAVIDRTEVSSDIFLDRNIWSTSVDARLAESTPVNIHIETEVMAMDTAVLVTAIIHYTSSVAANNNLSIALIENDIVQPQKLPDLSVDTFYAQQEVFRDMLTSLGGTALTTPDKEPGRVVEKQFIAKLYPHWDVDNMEVVIWVHEPGPTGEVYHAEHKELR